MELRSRKRMWVAAMAVVAVVGGGIALWAVVTETGSACASATSYPAIMDFDGRRYVGHGEPVRMPRPGPTLGVGVFPGVCDEPSREVEVRRLPGVQPEIAVLAVGSIWIVETLEVLPEEIAALDRKVPCRVAGQSEIVGDWIALTGSPQSDEGTLVTPYTAAIRAEEGESLPLEEYLAVTIKVRVTAHTEGGRDPALAEKVLRGPALLALTVRCDGDRFVADAMRLHDQ